MVDFGFGCTQSGRYTMVHDGTRWYCPLLHFQPACTPPPSSCCSKPSFPLDDQRRSVLSLTNSELLGSYGSNARVLADGLVSFGTAARPSLDTYIQSTTTVLYSISGKRRRFSDANALPNMMPNSTHLPSRKSTGLLMTVDGPASWRVLVASHSRRGTPGDEMPMVLTICAPRSSSTVVEPTKIFVPAHQRVHLFASSLPPPSRGARTRAGPSLHPGTPQMAWQFQRISDASRYDAPRIGPWALISSHLSYTSSCMKTLSSFFVSFPFRAGRLANYPTSLPTSLFSIESNAWLYCRKAIRWTGELSLACLLPCAEPVFNSRIILHVISALTYRSSIARDSVQL